MTPLPNRFPILRAAAIGALALLVAMMALVHPASAEGVAASCATGGAVPDEASTGLVSNCDALLVARDTLAGSATLNWSVDSSIADWEGVILAGSPAEVASADLTRVNIGRRRRAKSDGQWRKRCGLRAGTEGTNSELERRHGLGRLRVRGGERVRLVVYLKALACNVKRMVRARLDEMLVPPAALATAPTAA